MSYSVGDKIYNESYKNLVVLHYNEYTDNYIVCLERDLDKIENPFVDGEYKFVLDEKKLELFKVGYLCVNGEKLKFSNIYDKFGAIYVRSVGGSGFRVELDRTPYRILNEDEIKDYKHHDFRQKVLDSYGVEIDEELYRVEDVVKLNDGGIIFIGEIYDVHEDFISVNCGNGVLKEACRDSIIQWYPKDNLLNMKDNNFYEKIER